MRTMKSFLSVAAASLTMLGGAAFGQATIEVGSVEGSGTVEVTLATGGNDVAGTENDITFGPEIQLSNCVVNPEINRTASAFSFSPSGCTAGTDCESVKALVLSFTDLDPLPDGALLYTCDATVTGGTAPGEYTLGCANPGASDPIGNSVDSVCADGTVTVPDVPVAEIAVGSVTGVPGTTAQIEISLNLLESGVEVAGAENVLNFPAEARVIGCAVNEDIGREASAFSLSPTDCTPGTDCESVKALILSFTNLTGIPDGSVLYTCDVALPGGSAASLGTFAVTCSEPGTSDPEGNPLTTTCSDGLVTVEEPTPTPTPEPTSTNTPEPPTFTPTQDASPTPPNTATNTPTNTRSIGAEDDGCSVAAPRHSSGGWMFLVPMAGLLWLRRRAR
jgi:hypothetical protein